jgi:hypothetical protein
MTLQGCLNGDSGSEELDRGHTPLVGLDRFFGRQTSEREQARSHRILLLRPAEKPSGARHGREIYRSWRPLRDVSRCEDTISTLGEVACKLDYASMDTSDVYY